MKNNPEMMANLAKQMGMGGNNTNVAEEVD